MKDPRRWLHEPDQLDPAERAVLAAGVNPTPPPPEARQRVWAATLATLGQGGAGLGDAPSQAPAPPAAVSLDLRVWGSALLVGALAAVGLGLTRTSDNVAAAASWHASIPAVSIPAGPAIADGEQTSESTANDPPPPPHAPPESERPMITAASPHPRAVVASAKKSRLLEESLLLRRARASLRSGDVAGTVALLDDGDRRFANGQLGQERQALRVEVLTRIDQERAAREAKAFEERYPSSPHHADVSAKSDAHGTSP